MTGRATQNTIGPPEILRFVSAHASLGNRLWFVVRCALLTVFWMISHAFLGTLMTPGLRFCAATRATVAY